MKQLLKKQWEYVLYQNGQDFILSVVCGTVVLFDIKVILTKSEIEEYKQDGEVSIGQLADKIRNNPDEWMYRKID